MTLFFFILSACSTMDPLTKNPFDEDSEGATDTADTGDNDVDTGTGTDTAVEGIVKVSHLAPFGELEYTATGTPVEYLGFSIENNSSDDAVFKELNATIRGYLGAVEADAFSDSMAAVRHQVCTLVEGGETLSSPTSSPRTLAMASTSRSSRSAR